MSIHVALHHKTSYRYDRPVQLGPQVVRLRPAPHSRTRVLSYSLKIHPGDHFVNWQQDPFSNHLARLVFPEKSRAFEVEIDLVADMQVINPFDFFLDEEAREWPFAYTAGIKHELELFLKTPKPGPLLTEYLKKTPTKTSTTINFLMDLNMQLQKDIAYIVRMEPGVQSSEETLMLGRGSCRDSAWLLVEVLRNLGLAARFVSGYLIQLTPDVKSLDGPSGPENDFTDLHAWTEVFLPGAGWIGFDPTSGLAASEGHIPLACTPEASSAAPISGAVEECKAEFSHEMSVRRVHELPRVTKPYSEAAWREIEELGHRVDADLGKMDVRLTMGGEPTFVGIDQVDLPEWNIEALGQHKWERSLELFKRLSNRFATGPLTHHGQGKWYPGEQLPRWALDCYWRKDGKAIWRDPELLADALKDYGFGTTEAGAFTAALADRLEVAPGHTVPGYEDTYYYLWRERCLPTNVDVAEPRVKDPLERARIAKVFAHGLGKPIGYALPLRRAWEGGARRWFTGPWFFRSEQMYLIPGDSPMGLRLPLDSIPWVAEGDHWGVHETDPMAPRAPLPDFFPPELPRGIFRGAGRGAGTPEPARLRMQHKGLGAGGGDPEQDQDRWRRHPATAPLGAQSLTRFQSAANVVRTALTVEPRHGRLHIFMPPVETVEDYLDLITAVEDTAAKMHMPVIIEGYKPPSDPRLNNFSIKPDPGVIEVNIHPSSSWEELVENATILYDEARLSRLGTEKFMLDGRHTGTGGGNHVLLGAATPADSPFLRRPDLLKSLVSYWHNHPSLSYIFSGMFVGPTSQAPRVDEGRNDMVSELELAFAQVSSGAPKPPWFVDRALRNLLVDLTGNTHRSEFCIDKLFSPDSAAGRMGLVELRALEMPPHARMSLAQQLLIRSLVSRFWKEPYTVPLVRWHTELHDRFMLPHFVEQDFRDVLEEQSIIGYPFDYTWYFPHMEFRFPRCGSVTYRGVDVELRMAIEPWNVLGEEPAGGAMSRFIDSSVERMQIKVRGMVDSRHVITCNGFRVPLHPTGVAGEYVAGVRYQAWEPVSCLHPGVPVNTPLVVDVVDTWNGRSIGGCTYHVAHPGGLSYDQFPVNAFEAESRRINRFTSLGHTPGPLEVMPGRAHPEYPFTLDLRWEGV
ncbi:MAG: transglutaminase family protein [Candidatus Hydrogenedentes bacterium]|nr:transglutaminase family protein [Candidatus Hydrogenedentota bacterium]